MSYEKFERAQKHKIDFLRNLFQVLNRASNKQPKYSDSSISSSESSESCESESQMPKLHSSTNLITYISIYTKSGENSTRKADSRMCKQLQKAIDWQEEIEDDDFEDYQFDD